MQRLRAFLSLFLMLPVLALGQSMVYRFPGQIQSADGTVLLPQYSWSSDPNTGLYRIGADQIGFATGGVLRAQADATGFTVPAGQVFGLNGATLSGTVSGTPIWSGINSYSGGVTIQGDGVNLLFDGGTYDYDVDIVTDTVRFGRSATTGTIVQFYQPGTSTNLLKLQASGIDIGVSTINGTLTWNDGQTFSAGLVGLTSNARTSYWANANNASIYGTSVGGSGIFNQGGHLVLETRASTGRDVIIYGGNSNTVIAQIGDLSKAAFNVPMTITDTTSTAGTARLTVIGSASAGATGLRVRAGQAAGSGASGDLPFIVSNSANTAEYFLIRGDGSFVSFDNNNGQQFSKTAAGVLTLGPASGLTSPHVIQAGPASGIPLQIKNTAVTASLIQFIGSGGTYGYIGSEVNNALTVYTSGATGPIFTVLDSGDVDVPDGNLQVDEGAALGPTPGSSSGNNPYFMVKKILHTIDGTSSDSVAHGLDLARIKSVTGNCNSGSAKFDLSGSGPSVQWGGTNIVITYDAGIFGSGDICEFYVFYEAS